MDEFEDECWSEIIVSGPKFSSPAIFSLLLAEQPGVRSSTVKQSLLTTPNLLPKVVLPPTQSCWRNRRIGIAARALLVTLLGWFERTGCYDIDAV